MDVEPSVAADYDGDVCHHWCGHRDDWDAWMIRWDSRPTWRDVMGFQKEVRYVLLPL